MDHSYITIYWERQQKSIMRHMFLCSPFGPDMLLC